MNRLLRKLLRIVLFKRPTESVNAYLCSLKLMNFSQIYILQLLKLFLRIKDNPSNQVGLQLEKDSRMGPYGLRQTKMDLLKVGKPFSKFGSHMISYRIVMLLNYVHRVFGPVLDEMSLDLIKSSNYLKNIVYKIDSQEFMKLL